MTASSNDATDISEAHLMGLVERGDPAAERMIYLRYVRYLVAVCSRYIIDEEDVKDILHDSFLKIFSSVGSFEHRGEGSLKAWMTRIVVNEALKFLRDRNRLNFSAMPDDCIEIADDEPEVDEVSAELIYEMIRQLPAGYRTIFNLYVIEGRSHKEISGMLNITESTSASQLHRAKAMLAAKIRDCQNNNINILPIWATNG